MNPIHPRRLSILCAEDDEFMRRVLVRLLADAGYLVEAAVDGFDAWQKLQADPGRFDVLLTDHNMPNLTGLELVELLRAVNYPGLIMVHSTWISGADRALYAAFGVDRIMAKATRGADLLEAVEAFRLSRN